MDTLTGDQIITFVPGVIGNGDAWGTVLHLETGRLGVDVNLEDFTTRFVEPEYLAGLKAAIDHEIEQYGLHRSEVHLDDTLVIVLRHCRDLVEKIEKSGD